MPSIGYESGVISHRGSINMTNGNILLSGIVSRILTYEKKTETNSKKYLRTKLTRKYKYEVNLNLPCNFSCSCLMTARLGSTRIISGKPRHTFSVSSVTSL